MKKILIETNVALDILLHRQDYSNAKIIYLLAEKNQIACYISASAITDIFYLSEKDLGKIPAREALKTLLSVFKPATVSDNHIYQALDLDWNDFEDSVQYVVGESFSADFILTRNTQDFTSGFIPTLTPEQFLQDHLTN
jgi:predicted nucleic acid-binding protein